LSHAYASCLIACCILYHKGLLHFCMSCVHPVNIRPLQSYINSTMVCRLSQLVQRFPSEKNKLLPSCTSQSAAVMACDQGKLSAVNWYLPTVVFDIALALAWWHLNTHKGFVNGYAEPMRTLIKCLTRSIFICSHTRDDSYYSSLIRMQLDN
jgi:hypothetical protein